MRPLDLLFEAMERGSVLAEAGRRSATTVLDKIEASPLAGLLQTGLGGRLQGAVRGNPRRRLDVVPHPLDIRDPFLAEPKKEAHPEAARPIGDPSVPLLVYGRRTCLWTGRALRLAGDRELEHVFVDLDTAGLEHLERSLVQKTRHNGTPWIFARGTFVGGYGSLDGADRLGLLDLLFLAPEEREARAKELGLRFALPPPREDPGVPR